MFSHDPFETIIFTIVLVMGTQLIMNMKEMKEKQWFY